MLIVFDQTIKETIIDSISLAHMNEPINVSLCLGRRAKTRGMERMEEGEVKEYIVMCGR